MPQIMNYDHCLRFQVLDKRISFVDAQSAEVVADNRGNICIHIEFDEQWDGCGKTARFIYNGMWIDCPLNADNECICPSEVLKKGRFSLGVYGAELKTTTPIVVTVAASILSESGEELPADPTPGQYEQIITLYSAAITAADEATQAAWEAIENVNGAIKALNDAKKELEEQGFIEGIKETNNGAVLRFWAGSSEEYDAVGKHLNNTFCVVTDDTIADIFRYYDNTLEAMQNDIFSLGTKTSFLEGELTAATYLEAGGSHSSITTLLDKILLTMTDYSAKRIIFHDEDLDPELTYFCGTLYKTPTEAILDAVNTNYGLQVRLLKFNGVWDEDYEWVNPPMNANREYRTSERRNGSVVYIKRFYVGELPVASSMVVDIDFDFSNVVDVRGMAFSSTATIPFYSLGIDINFEEGMMIIATEGNASLYEAYIDVKYLR